MNMFSKQVQALQYKTLKNYSKQIRSLFYVPSINDKNLEKSLTLQADAICYDLEDSISDQQKSQARQNLVKFIKRNRINKEFYIRVNSLQSEYFQQDIDDIKNMYQNIFRNQLENNKNQQQESKQNDKQQIKLVIPKLETHQQLMQINNQFKDFNLKLLLLIESPIAIINLKEICLLAKILGIVDGLIFGADDLAAQLNVIRTQNSNELLYCRQNILLYAKAFNLQAIDMVNIHYKDNIKLQQECIDGYNLGFTGKQCIHPDQIQIVHEYYQANQDQIQWANKIKKSYEQQQDGVLSIDLNQKTMIDAPTYKQALNILKK